MSEQVTVKVPGKLMVAGEYAVLEPNQQLVVMAIDKFVYATVKRQKEGKLHLVDFSLENIDWKYNDGEIFVNSKDSRLTYVKNALKVTLQYLEEKGIDFSEFSLKIHSELDDASGLKYGLGSSAAVVTSVVSAVLETFKHSPSKDVVFKLAAIAHIQTQGNGSGADIAASTYGGMVKFTSFQAEWLLEILQKEKRLAKVVSQKWTYLTIKAIELPSQINVFVGWTGKPASTVDLVNKVRQLKTDKPKLYSDFLSQSKRAVDMIIKGMQTNKSEIFYDGIRENRLALATLGQAADVPIETEKLFLLSQEAEHFGGAGKLSGAGGGDCGLAFVPADTDVEQLYRAWELNGIVPLRISVCPDGVHLNHV